MPYAAAKKGRCDPRANSAMRCDAMRAGAAAWTHRSGEKGPMRPLQRPCRDCRLPRDRRAGATATIRCISPLRTPSLHVRCAAAKSASAHGNCQNGGPEHACANARPLRLCAVFKRTAFFTLLCGRARCKLGAQDRGTTSSSPPRRPEHPYLTVLLWRV